MTSAAKPSNKLFHAAFAAAWLVGAAICWNGETARLANVPADQPVWVAAITKLSHDTSLMLPLLLAAPFVWFYSTRPRRTEASPPPSTPCSRKLAFLVSLCLAAVAFGASLRISSMEVTGTGKQFGSLPPAYHDEYSYLVQAETIRAGRTKFPARKPNGVFDQTHVLNDDGIFASRYFPATGLWMAPFVASGNPWLGHQLANGLIAGLFCFVACRVSGVLSGVITGALIALAPGMAIFSNLLLAHHPTLVGLGLFTVGFFESRHSRPLVWGSLAGVGLSFAMLARPMSAAGFALPFGLWALARLLVDKENREQHLRRAIGLGVPILCGFAALAGYNRSVTGDYLTTPYSVYTNLYTPNHVYGFNNVTRGNRIEAPKRIAKYDGWAENLTPAVAARNAVNRLTGSFRWTLGLIPNAMLAVFCLMLWPRLRFEARLVMASIISLHVVHVPYWFDGIMHYHYVFETGVLWCLLAGIVAIDVSKLIQPKLALSAWCLTIIATSAVASWATLPHPFVANTTLFNKSQIQTELDGISFSRLRYERFGTLLNTLPKPALVLVEHDEADIHIDYINNPPTSDEPSILIGRLDAFLKSDAAEQQEFSNRSIFVFSAKQSTLKPFRP